jgi:hypothetical protein
MTLESTVRRERQRWTQRLLCARATNWTAARGRFAWPLECVKGIVIVLSILVATSGRANDEPRWAEYFKVFAAVRNETEESIIAEADAALATVGFHRDSTGTGYPEGAVPGIFASYAANDSARALILQASSPECLAFSATNYDRAKSGLVDRAGNAIKARFRAAFGTNVQFYSDAKCRVAL